MPISRDALGATFLDVVEKLTFMFGEELDKDELPPPGDEYAGASIDFRGDLAGTLTLIVDSGLIGEIAANILGMEADDLQTEEMMNDALQELLNVACGHVIMAIAGTQANFELDAPSHTVLDGAQYSAYRDDPDSAAFLLEDSPALLNLKLV